MADRIGSRAWPLLPFKFKDAIEQHVMPIQSPADVFQFARPDIICRFHLGLDGTDVVRDRPRPEHRPDKDDRHQKAEKRNEPAWNNDVAISVSIAMGFC